MKGTVQSTLTFRNPSPKPKPKSQPPVFTSRLVMNADGTGRVQLPEQNRSASISSSALNGAMHGDLVKVQVRQQEGKITGQVVGIVQRAHRECVGQVFMEKGQYRLRPYNYRLTYPILFHPSTVAGLQDGEYLVAQIIAYPEPRRPVVSVVPTKRLGMPGTPALERLVVSHEHKLPSDFPKAVLDEVSSLPSTIPQAEIHRRRDLRGERIFTIDGSTTKDFDDAVSVKQLPNGNVLLGVHIADVSFYVRPGTTLDREAFRKGTSVYFSDGTVIPMLPPKLSDDLCSLIPGQDRLAFTCAMEIDPAGNICSVELFESVIRSCARFTYAEVDELLDNPESTPKRDLGILHRDLSMMAQLARVLRRKRRNAGSLDLGVPQWVPVFDPAGKVSDVRKKHRLFSELLIEEFMLATNVAVTDFAHGLPFVYRMQPAPKPQRLQAVVSFLSKCGYQWNENGCVSGELSRLLKEAEDQGDAEMVRFLVLCELNERAAYSDQVLPHFNLNFPRYTHFTSPIRRYADLYAHRLLKNSLRTSVKGIVPGPSDSVAQQCTQRSEAADLAEREFNAWKKLQVLERFVGKRLDARIQRINGMGFFVQLQDYGLSSLIPFVQEANQGRLWQQKGFCLVDERTGKQWTVGMPVQVRVKEIDWHRRSPILELV